MTVCSINCRSDKRRIHLTAISVTANVNYAIITVTHNNVMYLTSMFGSEKAPADDGAFTTQFKHRG